MKDANSLPVKEAVIISLSGIQGLLDSLSKRGFQLIGPTVCAGAIVYDQISSINDLPAGWKSEQEGGVYRLKRRTDAALFGYAVGQHSWKQFLHPPEWRLWRAGRTADGFAIAPGEQPAPRFAFIGARSCDLHAIAILDKVFHVGRYVDQTYQGRRQGAFVVAVNCGQADGTCFCVSMNTGPKATFGYDISLTEVLEGEAHHFLAEAGTERGAEILSSLPCRPASEGDRQTASHIVAETARHMGRTMETRDIKELLYSNYEHPRWNNVAARCLNCANCTMVCPTCFCNTVEDRTDLSAGQTERWRIWDSCFTLGFSHIHGGSVRASGRSRYRQWMTHKLATWIDQFGTSGCVGCGRCITWCPVGIDITEEVRAIRSSQKRGS